MGVAVLVGLLLCSAATFQECTSPMLPIHLWGCPDLHPDKPPSCVSQWTWSEAATDVGQIFLCSLTVWMWALVSGARGGGCV